MFVKLAYFTALICKTIDSSLSDILAFDTSEIELYVTKNNPKTYTFRLKSIYVLPSAKSVITLIQRLMYFSWESQASLP